MTEQVSSRLKTGGGTALVLVGGIYIASAIAYPFVVDTPVATDLLIGALAAGSGLVNIYVGYRLPQSEIRSEAYAVVVKWCLRGIGAMLVLLGLTALAAGLRDPLQNVIILTAIGSVAGLAAGIHDARAKTRELELQETIERLKTANERLEQFAHAASHDLQEPLRMVSSYLQLIERRTGDELSEETGEYLEYAVDGAERMRRMVQGLQAYSEIERRGEPLETVDLEAVFEAARSDMQARIEESRAEIEADPLPRVQGDADQLRRVFENLLDNAIEYSGDEPPRITVSAERDGTTCEIAVSDEGIGIDADSQQRVFEVFERLHVPDEHPGSGIGLAVCKRIIERHGGDIRVESEPGVGSTFTFTLPAAGDGDE